MELNITKPEYGNWVPKSALKTFTILCIVFGLITVVSFFPFTEEWIPDAVLLWGVRGLLSMLCCLLFCGLFIFYRAHRVFAYDGGRLSQRIITYVAGHVQCEDAKRILDIGCGSGALAIEMAKRFPGGEVTGIDYWGKGWNYGQSQCERNARIEGVEGRIRFMRGDAAKLPFADGEFDVVVSNFVFHEVQGQPDKKLVVKEALRVVKPNGLFVFHDLFYDKSKYGCSEDLEEFLKGLTQEVHLKPTVEEIAVPKSVRTGIFLKNIGLIYGVK